MPQNMSFLWVFCSYCVCHLKPLFSLSWLTLYWEPWKLWFKDLYVRVFLRNSHAGLRLHKKYLKLHKNWLFECKFVNTTSFVVMHFFPFHGTLGTFLCTEMLKKKNLPEQKIIFRKSALCNFSVPKNVNILKCKKNICLFLVFMSLQISLKTANKHFNTVLEKTNKTFICSVL